MRLCSSSTSSSEARSLTPPRPIVRTRARGRIAGLLVVAAWTLLFLAVYDVAINQLFRCPADPSKQPSKMQLYFDYGRSVKGKLARMIGSSDSQTARLAQVGWIKQWPTKFSSAGAQPAGHTLRVSV